MNSYTQSFKTFTMTIQSYQQNTNPHYIMTMPAIYPPSGQTGPSLHHEEGEPGLAPAARPHGPVHVHRWVRPLYTCTLLTANNDYNVHRLQRGRQHLVRVQPSGPGRQRQREPGRVLGQGGAGHQCGHLLRVRIPVPRHECTQGHLRRGF